MLNLYDVIILGIVEGITEFLPISSTGHLIITNHFLNLEATDFLSTFQIFIQLGAISAVLFLFGYKLFRDKKLVLKVLTAFIPTALIGLALYPLIKNFLLKSDAVVVGALFAGGVVLILFEWWYAKRGEVKVENLEQLTYLQALVVGVGQSLAVIPGVSRSGATIVSGLALGLSRGVIVEFSFLLAVPTMLAASGYDLFKQNFSFSGSELFFLAIGFMVSFGVALLVVKWLLFYVREHSFMAFGFYRVLLAVVLWWVIF